MRKIGISLLVVMIALSSFAYADSPASWAKGEVKSAVSEGIVPSSINSNYAQSITRQEFCMLAIKVVEKYYGKDVASVLSDKGLTLPSKSTFKDTNSLDVLYAKALGITSGTGANTFSPNDKLTREQAAKFLSMTAKVCGQDIKASAADYADQKAISSWAKPYVAYVDSIDVMKGVGKNKFDPKGSYQRQQGIVTGYRLLKVLKTGNAAQNVDIPEGKNSNISVIDLGSGNDLSNLVFKDINGKLVKISDYKGKPVLITFFGTL